MKHKTSGFMGGKTLRGPSHDSGIREMRVIKLIPSQEERERIGRMHALARAIAPDCFRAFRQRGIRRPRGDTPKQVAGVPVEIWARVRQYLEGGAK